MNIDDSLTQTSIKFLEGFPQIRKTVILQEAQRLKERRSSIPWYAERAKTDGEVFWLRLAISYGIADPTLN